MPGSDDLPLWYSLNRLIAEYWAEVDENGGRDAHQFYLAGAFYAMGNNRFDGIDKIRAFYLRRSHGLVETRHLISNVRVFREDDHLGRVLGVMSLYHADGRSAFQGATPPAMIADFDALCVLGDDQRWRFQSHELRPFMVGNDYPASMMIRPRGL